MDAAPCPVVSSSWRGVARTIAIAIAIVVTVSGGAQAQSRGGDAAGTLSCPWQPETSATSVAAAAATAGTSAVVRERTTTPTSAPGARPRDTDALARPDRAPAAPPPVTLDLAIATHVPVSLGVEANLVMPLGLLLRAHVGFMPEPYVGLINDVAQTFGAYDDQVASVVSRSGQNSFVLRLSGGIRPVPGYGFEILAGYTMIRGGAHIATADFEAATGQSMNYPGLDAIGISAVLHAIHVEIGWSALVWDHLVIRASIGWMHTLAAEDAIDVPADLRARAGGRIEEIENSIRRGLTTWAFTPEARIGIGYQF